MRRVILKVNISSGLRVSHSRVQGSSTMGQSHDFRVRKARLAKKRKTEDYKPNSRNVGGACMEDYTFYGVSSFPSEVSKYACVVVELTDGISDGIYVLNNLNDYSIIVNSGCSGLVQIVAADPKKKLLNTKNVESGEVKYFAHLDDVTKRLTIGPVKPYSLFKGIKTYL